MRWVTEPIGGPSPPHCLVAGDAIAAVIPDRGHLLWRRSPRRGRTGPWSASWRPGAGPPPAPIRRGESTPARTRTPQCCAHRSRPDTSTPPDGHGGRCRQSPKRTGGVPRRSRQTSVTSAEVPMAALRRSGRAILPQRQRALHPEADGDVRSALIGWELRAARRRAEHRDGGLAAAFVAVIRPVVALGMRQSDPEARSVTVSGSHRRLQRQPRAPPTRLRRATRLLTAGYPALADDEPHPRGVRDRRRRGGESVAPTRPSSTSMTTPTGWATLSALSAVTGGANVGLAGEWANPPQGRSRRLGKESRRAKQEVPVPDFESSGVREPDRRGSGRWPRHWAEGGSARGGTCTRSTSPRSACTSLGGAFSLWPPGASTVESAIGQW